MQVVVQLPGNEVAHKGADGFPFRADGVGPQLGFGLGFEDGFLYLDGDGGYEGGADVPCLIIFLKKSLRVLTMASRNAAWWVPPWVVCCPLTKE